MNDLVINVALLEKIMTIAGLIAGFSLNTVLKLIPEEFSDEKKFIFIEDFPRLFLFLSTIFLISAAISIAIICSLVNPTNPSPQFKIPTDITLYCLLIGFSFFYLGTVLNAFRWKTWFGWTIVIISLLPIGWCVKMVFWPPL